MAIRYRKGRASPWQCYWNNPLTGKRECANFGTQHEAEKHDSLIKHRIKFDRESFRKEEDTQEKHEVLTLEGAYLLYLKQKQFSKESIRCQLKAMWYPLKMLGNFCVAEITRKHIESVMDLMGKMPIKAVTIRDRLRVFRTVLRWCANNGLRTPVDFPQLQKAHYENSFRPRGRN